MEQYTIIIAELCCRQATSRRENCDTYDGSTVCEHQRRIHLRRVGLVDPQVADSSFVCSDILQVWKIVRDFLEIIDIKYSTHRIHLRMYTGDKGFWKL